MGHRAGTPIPHAQDTEATTPIDEDLEEVLEDALDDAADRDEADELEEVIEEAPAEEAEEAEVGETEAAIEVELELEIEDRAAINEEAMLEVLLRRTGVLPEETEIGAPNNEARLPPPRREDEFVCSSCFLIKPRRQLGNAARLVCRDCLDPPDTEPVG